jgi:hypothetical protein
MTRNVFKALGAIGGGFQAVGRVLFHHRLRRWRYVSTGRHVWGLSILAVMFLVLHLYWVMTNDANVRRWANHYLQELTGAHITIGEAHFGFFDGIRLKNVRAFIDEDDRQPFFETSEIVLWHRPWALAVGKFEPVRIVFSHPRVLMEHDAETGRYAFESLLNKEGGMGGLGGDLPVIVVDQARYLPVEVQGGIRAKGRVSVWDAVFTPDENDTYQITFQESRSSSNNPLTGRAVLDVANGRLASVDVSASSEMVSRVLSGEFAEWYELYRMEGDFRLEGAEDNTEGPLELVISDVSLTLPPDQGGLELVGVSGVLGFPMDPDRPGMITLNDLTGRVAQCPEAKFTLTGESQVVADIRTFDLNLTLTGMSIPDANPAGGFLGEAFDAVVDEYAPQGTMNVTVVAQRDDQGEVIYQGEIIPQDMTVCFKHFPLELDDVTGIIGFDQTGIGVIDLTGRRGEARVDLVGSARRGDVGEWLYDVTVEAFNVPLDDATKDAIPHRMVSVWESLNPEGSTAIRAHATRLETGVSTLKIVLDFKGQAAITYEEFPYRLETLFGTVNIEGNEVHIDRSMPLTGSHGATACTIYGDVTELDAESPKVDLKIAARRVAIDEDLLAALPERVAESITESQLTGEADRAWARVLHADGETDFNVQVEMTDVAFTIPEFPLPVEQGYGSVTIEPDRLILKTFEGQHGGSPISISGQLCFGMDPLGVDLDVRSPNFQTGSELYYALPEKLRTVYDAFHPVGQAGMTLQYRQNMPDQLTDEVDYRLVLEPQGMQIRYEHFPYTFRGVTGQVIIEPDQVELVGLLSRHGKMAARFDGVIVLEPTVRGQGMTIQAKNVPINKELLNAMPEELSALADQFSVGGTCWVNLSRVDFERQPDDPAVSDDEPQLHWYAKGDTGVEGAVIGLGMGDKTLTGKLSGKIGRNETGLAIDADLDMTEIRIGPRRITDVTGQMSKAYTDNVLYIDEMIGSVHQGRLTGFAEILMDDPVEYGVNLSVEDIDLNDLLNAGTTDPKDRIAIQGKLDGTVQLIAESNNVADRRASGVLRIGAGAMGEMPVVLGAMHVVTLELPGDTMFTDSVMSYRLEGNTLTFEEINLVGPSLGMVGAGTLDMKTEGLDLVFLAGAPPAEGPRLVGIEEFVQNVAREVSEIEVTGTLSAPQTRSVPFRGVDEALKLLDPSRDEE